MSSWRVPNTPAPEQAVITVEGVHLQNRMDVPSASIPNSMHPAVVMVSDRIVQMGGMGSQDTVVPYVDVLHGTQ